MPNNTDIIYNGQVNLQIKIGDKLINLDEHNEGTYYLKKVFAMAMCGVSIGSQHIPQYIDLMFSDPTATVVEWKSALKQQLSLTSKTYSPTTDNDSVNPSASFTATLASSNLTMTIDEMSANNYSLRIDLITGFDSKGAQHTLATLPIAISKLEKLSSGMQAVITWTMRLLNTTEV